VRQARLRLLAGAVLRHLQQKKTHLAEEKLAELAALPQAGQGDRPAFLEALRYMTAEVRDAHDEAAGHRAEAERLFGSKAAAALLIFAVGDACKRGKLERPMPIDTFAEGERANLPEAMARVVQLAKDVQIEMRIPNDWLTEAEAQLARGSQSLSVAQLAAVAEIGLESNRPGLTYEATAAGLERGGPSEANFLLLRARCLPYNERRAVCAAAAAQLAREQRQMDVVDKAVQLLSNSPFDDLKFTTEQAATVVKTEKAERKYPAPNRRGPGYADLLGESACDCPKCRRARAEGSIPFDDLEDDDGGEFDIEQALDEIPIPPGMPPELGRIVIEEALKGVQNGESVDSVMSRIFGPPPGSSGKGKKGGRR
jgi:hypothetical protein